MGRKNNRRKSEYRTRLGFNPRKYISPAPFSGYSSQAESGMKSWDARNRIPHRGDIWFADLGDHPGTSIQSGCRPVFIVSNNIGNYHAETLNVLPMTRHLKKPELPCHTELNPEVVSDNHQILDASMILAEQITTISKSQLRNYVGRVEDEDFTSLIDHAVSQQLALEESNRLPGTQGSEETAINFEKE